MFRIESLSLSVNVSISGNSVRLVFFSNDRLEVERVKLALMAASIPCEVRTGFAFGSKFQQLPEAEVWIKRDEDLHQAFLLFFEHNIGFAKRAKELWEHDFSRIAIAA